MNPKIQKYLFSRNIDRNPLVIFKNYEQLQEILTSLGENLSKFCYAYSSAINKILYDSEEIINIENNKNNISYYIHLALAIELNPNIINYSYSFDLINDIFGHYRKKEKKIKKIIIFKIIQELINNYYGIDNSENEKFQGEIQNILNYCKEEVNNSIDILKEYNLSKHINDINLDELYREIIKKIIINEKLKDEEYIQDLIEQLVLGNINIICNMFDDLFEILNNNEPYIRNYYILEKSDLFNENKVNFYYYLIKYILKDRIYIYQIQFLYKTRKYIIKLLKEKNFTSFKLNNVIKEKQNFILKELLDSDYYYNIYLNNKDIEDALKIILNYYEKYLFESKGNDITLIKEIIRNKQGEYGQYLKDLEKAKEMNDKYELIKLFYDLKYNELKEEQLTETINNWEFLSKCIKDKKIKKFKSGDKKAIFQIFNDKNKNLLLKYFNQDDYNFIISKSNIYDKDYLKEIRTYYEYYFFESKKDDIKIIETALKNNTIEKIYEKYKQDYNEAKRMNERYNIIDYIYNLKNNEDNKPKSEAEVQKDIEAWNVFEKLIVDNKFKKMQKNSKSKLFEYLNKNSKEELLKIFSNESYNIIVKENQRNQEEKMKKELKSLLNYYEKNFPESRKAQINLIKNYLNKNQQNYENANQIFIGLINNDEENKKEIINALGENAFDEIIGKKNKISGGNNEEIKEKDINKFIEKNNLNSTGSYFNSNINQNIEDPIILQKKEKCEQILKKSEIIFHTNKKRGELNFIYDKINYGEDKKEINEEELYQLKKIPENINDNSFKNINYYLEFIEEVKKRIKNEFELNYILKLKLGFINEKENPNKFQNGIIYNNSCIFTFYPPNSKYDNKRFKEDNIFVYKTNSFSQGFNLLLQEINNKKYLEQNSDILINENKILCDQILTKSEIIFHTNKKGEKPYIICDEINYGDHRIKIYEERLNQMKEVIDVLDDEYKKNYNYYLMIFEEVKKRIEENFNHNYSLRIKLEFKRKEKNKIVNNRYNISCFYTFYPPISNCDEIVFKDENIFNNSLSEGFNDLLLEINDNKYKYIEYLDKKGNNSNYQSEKSTADDYTKINNEKINKEIDYENSAIGFAEESMSMEIIRFLKVIGNHQEGDQRAHFTAEFIKELSNGYFISGGTDNILKVYTRDFSPCQNLEKIDIIKDWTYNICERNSYKNKSETKVQIIACSNKDLYLINLDFNKGKKIEHEKFQVPNASCTNCIEMKDSNYAIVGLNSTYYFEDLFKKEKGQVDNFYPIIEKTYRGAIRIKDDLLALCSNENAVNGEDRLVFINPESNKIVRSIKNYSFNFSVNALSLIPKSENGNRILLCACKKYFNDKKNDTKGSKKKISEQKNGILIVNTNLGKNQNIINPFYDTGEFEVFCFCPIVIYDEVKIIQDSGDGRTKDTDYFFVGGFDNEKREGKIKLYKVNFNDDMKNTEIEFIQDIEFRKTEEFNGFDWPISCIIQSSLTCNVLVTSYDGKVYLFSAPNLTFFMNNREKIDGINLFGSIF